MGLASILYFSVFPNEGICIRLHKNIRVLTSRITSPTTHRTKLSPSRCETQGTSINSSRCQIQICGFWHSDPYTSIMCTRYYPLSISHTLETYLHTDTTHKHGIHKTHINNWFDIFCQTRGCVYFKSVKVLYSPKYFFVHIWTLSLAINLAQHA